MKQKLIQGKSIFYTLIIIFLCIVDQRRGSAAGHVQFIYINLAGVAICLLRYRPFPDTAEIKCVTTISGWQTNLFSRISTM